MGGENGILATFLHESASVTEFDIRWWCAVYNIFRLQGASRKNVQFSMRSKTVEHIFISI